MKELDTKSIENILRQAPQIAPPEDLRQRLQATVPSPIQSSQLRQRKSPFKLLNDWLPRLGFAGVFVLGAAWLTAQPGISQDQKAAQEALNNALRDRDILRQESVQRQGKQTYLENLRREHEEVQALRREREQLLSVVNEADRLQQENDYFREQLTIIGGSNPLLTRDPLGEARENARSVMCLNNIKQLALAYQVARDQNASPAEILDLIPHLGGTAPVVCPSDESKEKFSGENIHELAPHNISYDWLLTGPRQPDSSTVMFQCPIHHHIGLGDGSAHKGSRIENGTIELINHGGNLKARLESQ